MKEKLVRTTQHRLLLELLRVQDIVVEVRRHWWKRVCEGMFGRWHRWQSMTTNRRIEESTVEKNS